MEKVCAEKIQRNEARLNNHSQRLGELERNQIAITKDSENLINLLEKLEETINTLNKTVITMERSSIPSQYKFDELNKKVTRLYTDLEILKQEDGEKWKHYTKLVIGGLITTAVGYIIGGF